MANREIKTTLKLDGEQQFRKAMKAASDAVKVLNSEEKLAAAQFQITGDKEQFLSDKADILRRKIEEQQKAVKAAQEAVTKLKEKGVDPNSKAMQDWTIKLNNSQTQLTRLQGQLNATESEITQQGDAFDDAAGAANDYNSELQNIGKGIDFQNVTVILDNMHERLNKALTMVTNLSTAVYNAVTDAGKWADEIATEASKAGIDVETYQSWMYASQFIDTEVSAIVSSRQRLLKAMTSDNDETIKLFNALGVVVRENNGDLRDQTDVFWDVIDALGRVEDPTMRDYYAQELLGKSAKELNPLIEAGSQAYKDLAEEGREVAVVSGENVEKLGKLNDAQNKLNSELTKLKTDTLAGIAPAFTEATEKAGALVQAFNKFAETDEGKQAIEDLNAAIDALFDAILDKLDPETVINVATEAIKGLTGALEWISENGWTIVAILAGMKGLMATITVAKGFLEVLTLIKSINWLNVQKGAKGIGEAMGGGGAAEAGKAATETAKSGGLWQSVKGILANAGAFVAQHAGGIGAATVGVGSLYLADALDKAYTEKHYGDYNATLANYDAYFFDTADKKIQRMQRIMDEFKRAEEYEDENGSVDIERIKKAFQFNANAILEALPELEFWDYVKENVDLSDKLSSEEIEEILGLDYLTGMTWEDLAMDVVAGLAKGISENAGEATEAAQTMADDVTQTIEDAWAISSPSRVMFDLGAFAAQGLADGINARAAVAIAAAANLAAQVQVAMNGAYTASLAGYGRAMSGAIYSAPSSYYGGLYGGSGGGAGSVVDVTLMMDKEVVGKATAPIIDKSIGYERAVYRE